MAKLNKILEEISKDQLGFNTNDTMGLSGPIHPGIIHGLRHPSKNGLSGWYVWQGDYKEDADFFNPIHMSHVVQEHAVLEKYFMLPPGHRFLIDTTNGYEDVWYDEKLLDI